jgi:ABC-type lipoprotein release transport system permease subunit
LLGVVLASAFFAGINVGADSMAKRALDQRLAETPVDLTLRYYSYSDREHSFPSSDNLTRVVDLASTVEGVVSAEVNTVMYVSVESTGFDERVHFICAGLFDDSRVYDGMTGWAGELGINETLIPIDSPYADKLQVGDLLTFNITASFYEYVPEIEVSEGFEETFPVTLTIAGFISLTDEAYTIATGFSGGILYESSTFSGVIPAMSDIITRRESVCLVSWSTFAGFIDALYAVSIPANPFQIQVSVFLDRVSLVNPWDVTTSLERVASVTAQISNKVELYGFHVYEDVASALWSYQYTANNLRFGSIVTSLPIFFIAWYMASTVASVSFNLRRREIGLLLSKGASRGQLLRIFLGEAFLIGLMGGVMGVGLSFVLSPLFVEWAGGVFGGQVVLGVDTVVMTTVFGVAITLTAIVQPARIASKLNPVDAVREYLYVDEVKPYKRALPLTALILGTFKIIILALGINLQQVLLRVRYGNIFLMILLSIVIALDGVLTYIGPLLFFWGVTKVFIQGSVAFQGLSTRLMKGLLGDLGSLATRNVLRNPGRTAAIAFLIALIIGYAFSVNGALASEQEYARRQIYYEVGCTDLSIELSSSTNTSTTITRVENVPGIAATTVEYRFYGESSAGGLYLRAVDPDAWSDIGYYEDEWFVGINAHDALQTLAVDNRTIILDYSLAKYLDLEVSDTITITFEGTIDVDFTLQIVGFFGSEQSQSPIFPMLDASVGYLPRGYWSYVSHDVFEAVNGTVYASGNMLVKLTPEANSTTVVAAIRNLDPPIGWVSSVDELRASQQGRAELSGIINIQRLGIIFSVLAASIGMGLVTIVSLRERRNELSLISIRGASYKQSIITLLSESLAVMVFAMALGSAVGLIIVHGNISSANALAYSLVKRRLVFTVDSLAMLLSGYLLVFASMMVPVFLINRRYMSRLGDVIRHI